MAYLDKINFKGTVYDLQDSNLKQDINNSVDLTEYDWAIGAFDATGGEISSTTRLRSDFIPVTEGTIIKVSGNITCLNGVCYNANKEFLNNMPSWGSSYIIPSGVSYFRFMMRKANTNPTISDSDIDSEIARASVMLVLPQDTYYLDKDVAQLQFENEQFIDSGSFNMEIGGISSGIPSDSAIYVRNADYLKANIGDKLVIVPTTFTVNGTIYKYSAKTTGTYYGADTITNTPVGSRFVYTFTEDCYFKIRAFKNSYDTITTSDLLAFESITDFTHYYSKDNFVIDDKSLALSLDYDTLRSAMSGKINIALQTDTHMADYTNFKYDGTKYAASDFIMFKSILSSIKKLGVDAFINLGDIVRGYEFDPDYETRASIDKIIKYYCEYITSPKMFVIGNHDDGNMWYYGSRYNQKQNVENVLYPNEQFNRVTKFGLNSGKNINYHYADISGIRFITLWQKDFDYADGIPQNEDFKIGTDQLTWLSNTALDTNLPVVVLTHAPLITSLYAHGGTGFSDAVTAIETFANNGGTVVAILSGHTHGQASAQVNGINHIVFANGYNWFELISIDLVNSTITCKAINKTLADITYSF